MTMLKYEAMLIVNPSVDEEGMKAVIQKFTDLINKDGEVEKVVELGKKRLAYEIKKLKEAYYVAFFFRANPAHIAEIERVLRITDNVVKYLIIKD